MTYSDCMNQITKDEIFSGLLGYGLFSDRLPPFLTSEKYLIHAISNPFSNKKYDSQYIFYDNYRNINIPRILAIPTPFAYENLCRVISENWELLQAYFADKTSNNSYKISRIHIRKLAKTNALFKMNYDKWKIDGFPEPDLLIDKKYLVKADISNCFPSMYTHSLAWALATKPIAKQNSRNPDEWYNKIDTYSQKIKDKETHGFLIGPHVSNLLSEIILVDIDEKLSRKWNYIRKIDDYSCYVKTKEEADSFLLDLVTELKKYDLLINQKKISVIELPQTAEEDWRISLNKAKYLLFSNPPCISYNNLKNYLDTVVELTKKYKDAAILNYALKILSGIKKSANSKKSKIKFSDNAIVYFKKIIVHYILLYPYLIQFFEELGILPFEMTNEDIYKASNLFFNEGITKKNFELCSYALLFSIKNNSLIDSFEFQKIINSDHCILLLLSYLYANKHNLSEVKMKLLDYAKQLAQNKEYFERNWLFVYELLQKDDLNNEWKCIKKKKISFIDETKLTDYKKK